MLSEQEINQRLEDLKIRKQEEKQHYLWVVENLDKASKHELEEAEKTLLLDKEQRRLAFAELVKRKIRKPIKPTIYGYTYLHTSGRDFNGWGLINKFNGRALEADGQIVGFASSEIAEAFNQERLKGEYYPAFRVVSGGTMTGGYSYWR